jgi:hypothetical protein
MLRDYSRLPRIVHGSDRAVSVWPIATLSPLSPPRLPRSGRKVALKDGTR